MRIALFEPDIAGNVGTILRTAACLGAGVDLIEPMGFPWSDRALARSGMDYAGQAEVRRHADWDSFAAAISGRLVLFTTRGAVPLSEAQFEAGDILLFGAEGRGVPDYVHARLTAIADDLHIDEIMAITVVHDHEARKRSYELLAQAFNVQPREPVSAK